MGYLDHLYKQMPTWAQHLAVSLYGYYWKWLRFGKGYSHYLNEYIKREKFSTEEWQAWQKKRLKQLLPLAQESVPYYQKTWGRAERAAVKAGRLDDLPLLEKAPLRANPQAFLRQDIQPRKQLVFHTSGSTGTPIATYWTIQELRDSLALREARSARWAGVSFREPRATFSGRIVEPDPESSGPFYRFNLAEHQVYFSAFHLRPETVSTYAAALRKHKIKWLTGYAVSYYLMAKFILDQKIVIPTFKAIITTSEKLTPEMRATMQLAFGCRVYEEYSTVENALFASECDHGSLHISPDVSIIEILRLDGSPCKPGEIGEVVTTCFLRTYQPLIRFRLGDLAMWDPDPCPCGRQMPVIKEVIGRIEDIVVGPDGRQMVRFHGIFTDQTHVREGQIIQESLDRIRVKIVPTDGFNQHDVQDLVSRVQQRLGPQVQVRVEAVDQIPRNASGKFQAVISYLHKQDLPPMESENVSER